MATVGEIAIIVGADVGPMVRELGKGKGALSDFGNAGSKIGGILGTAMGKAAVGVGAAATALIALTKVSMSNIDAMSKQARAVGISVSSFQAMAMVAEEAGVESDKMSKILIKMQDNIASLAMGTKAQVEQFDALGLSMSDLAGLGADEQFALIAEKIANISDPTTKTAAALDVFGKSGADAITMLDGYAAAVGNAAEFQRDFGIAVSDEQAQGIEAANDAVGRLGMAFEGLGNTIAVAVAPVIESFAGGLANLIGAMISSEETALKFFNTVSNYQAVMDEFGGAEAAAALAGGWMQLEAVLAQSNGIETLREMERAWQELYMHVEVFTTGMARQLHGLEADYPILVAALNSMVAEAVRLEDALQEALASGDVALVQQYTAELQVAVDNLQAAATSAEALSGVDFGGTLSWVNGLEDAFWKAAEAASAAASAAASIPGAMGGADLGQTTGNADWTKNDLGFTLPGDELLGMPEEKKRGGGGGGGSNPFQARIDALVTSLQTEREIIAAWYEESLLTLQTATEAELAALGGKHEATERLEEEHQKRLAAIKEMGNQWGVQAALSGGAEILGALGQNNKKILKISKAFAAAEALVSTYQGAAAELKKGTFGFASAAAVIAKGIGFISAIRGASESGTSRGGGDRGGSGGGSSAAPERNVQTLNFNLSNDPFGFGQNLARQIAAQLNEAQRNGSTLIRANVT